MNLEPLVTWHYPPFNFSWYHPHFTHAPTSCGAPISYNSRSRYLREHIRTYNCRQTGPIRRANLCATCRQLSQSCLRYDTAKPRIYHFIASDSHAHPLLRISLSSYSRFPASLFSHLVITAHTVSTTRRSASTVLLHVSRLHLFLEPNFSEPATAQFSANLVCYTYLSSHLPLDFTY
jgi:hypothetical protein